MANDTKMAETEMKAMWLNRYHAKQNTAVLVTILLNIYYHEDHNPAYPNKY
jgi:hypothetical protein